MNQVFIDNALLASAGITAILVTRFTKSRTAGAFPSFLLLFAPLVTFFNMWAHTIAVSIVNVKRFLAGGFHYSFSFYSLLLFGIVFIITSGFNIDCARKRIKGDSTQKKKILWLNFATALLFLPVMFLNPIALLPVIASLVSSVTLWVMKAPAHELIYEKRDKHSTGKREAELAIMNHG